MRHAKQCAWFWDCSVKEARRHLRRSRLIDRRELKLDPYYHHATQEIYDMMEQLFGKEEADQYKQRAIKNKMWKGD